MTQRVRHLYWLAAVASLIPIWTPQSLPFQDGGSHLYNGAALLEWLGGNPAYRQAYTLSMGSASNYLDHLLLGAMSATIGPEYAEKILVTGLLLGLAAAAEYAAGAPIAFLLLPFGHCVFLNLGFYNFMASLPVFLVAAGRMARGGPGFSPFAETALPIALALCHPFSLAVWAMVRMIHACLRAQAARTLRPAVSAGLALLPGLLLTVHTSSSTAASTAAMETRWPAVASLLRGLPASWFFWSFDAFDAAAGLVNSLLFAIAAWLAWRNRHSAPLTMPEKSWLLTLPLLIAAYFALPDEWRTFGFINKRVTLFIFLGFALTLARRPMGARSAMLVVAGGLFLTAFVVVRHTVVFSRFDGHIRVFRQCLERVEAGSAVYVDPASVFHDAAPESGASWQVRWLLSAAGVPAVRRKLLLTNDYEGSLTYFPLRYVPAAERRPADYILTRSQRTWPGYGAACSSPQGWVMHRRIASPDAGPPR